MAPTDTREGGPAWQQARDEKGGRNDEPSVGVRTEWKIKLIIFVGGTCGSVHTQTFNNNLKELGVVESKRNSIRKESCMSCSMHRIWSCAHTLRRDQESGVQAGVELGMWKKLFKGWTASFEVWSDAVGWN